MLLTNRSPIASRGFLLFLLVLQAPLCAQMLQPPAPPRPAIQPTGPERFEGTVFSKMEGATLNGKITIAIDRYSADSDASALAAAFASGGQEALDKKILALKPTGTVKVGSSECRIVFARSAQSPSSRLVRVLTDRPIGPGGKAEAKLSPDHRFGYIEILFPSESNGFGTLVAAAQVGFSAQGQLRVTSFSDAPAQVNDVVAGPPQKK